MFARSVFFRAFHVPFSVRLCAALCGSVRLCAALCGSVRLCAALCGSVRLCAFSVYSVVKLVRSSRMDLKKREAESISASRSTYSDRVQPADHF